MKEYFTVGEAAKAAGMTAETLRHYDRIGLIKPSKKDEWTNYRYYTQQDIVALTTVHALQQMDLPLQKIKEVLAYDDLQKITAFLSEAEKKADEKIASLQYAKSKIQLAKTDYEGKLQTRKNDERPFIQYYPQRVILLSDTLKEPALDVLWNYLSHFYEMVGPERRDAFAFEDLAGVYTENGVSRLFAVCTRYEDVPGLKALPAGEYLCAGCTGEERARKLEELLHLARDEHGAQPAFTIQQVIVSGILQWRYQLQVWVGGGAKK
ncbi:MAG TPA: MerR family transcriptional regulator [Firmicutes bacterium]|nr:MerR family transcriptional regulator [Bacillota bacterium]